MSIQLSSRLNPIRPSLTFAIAARARALKAEGHPVISLSVGEPDFDTPEPIKQAAQVAMQQGFTKYTPIEGIPELRDAIVSKFKKDNQLDFTPDQIIVSCGAKQSLYNLFQAVMNPDDEAIILAPYWTSYPDMVLLAGGKPVVISAGFDQGFKITPSQLEAAITPKTRVFLINSPSNPSGAVYTKAELKALGEVLLKHPNVLVATDDIYEHNTWADEPFANIFNACPDLLPRGIIINGVSKAYAMTGWRIGYAAAPADLTKAMKTVQGQCTSGACSISQKAATAALTGDQDCVATMTKAFKERHDYLTKALNGINGIECRPSHGTFYAFPKIEGAMQHLNIKDDLAFGDYLINECHLAVVPGSAFGTPGHMRLSYATSLANLQESIKRLQKALET